MNTHILDWQGPPIQVVGFGCQQQGLLPTSACTALASADCVVAAADHAKILEREGLLPRSTKVLGYPSPLEKLTDQLNDWCGQHIVIIASGDPLFFGIGEWLLSRYGTDALVFHSNVNSVQAACARLGLSSRIPCVSLHGRPLSLLHSIPLGLDRYALLTDKINHPQRIAQELASMGKGHYRFHILSDLGTATETLHTMTVTACLQAEPLPCSTSRCVVIVETGNTAQSPEPLIAEGTPNVLPGLADEAFDCGDNKASKMITRREIRLNVLTMLDLPSGSTLWDVGAGCGSVSVEWARIHPTSTVYAIEKQAERMATIQRNSECFGTTHNLKRVTGEAPQTLTQLPSPHGVFIGGGGSALPAILSVCWQRLIPGGVLVVAAVTEGSRATLNAFADEYGLLTPPTEWLELSASHGRMLHEHLVMSPRLPVLLARMIKTATEPVT